MTPPALSQLVQPVIRRYRAYQMWRGLALCWTLTGIGVLALIAAQRNADWQPSWALNSLLGFAALSGFLVWSACRRFAPDLQWIARQIEEEHPELNSLLLAAVEQQPDESGQYSYLQQRVIREAIEHAARSRWAERFSNTQTRLAKTVHWLVLAVVVGLMVVYVTPTVARSEKVVQQQEKIPGVVVPEYELSVDPGDTELERGSSLVVMARFGERFPSEVNLVINSGTDAARIMPMVKSMKDPVFGTTVTSVDQPFSYQVAFADGESETFKVNVYEHPSLERSNVEIDYPDYTRLEDQKIENTKRVTAVEESKITLELELNKPVEHAALVSPTETIELTTSEEKAVATVSEYVLRRKDQFKLVLRDSDGRMNKVANRFVFVALRNRPPEMKFLFPKGDQRVSALEEMQFEIQAYDDFGLSKVGFSYRLAGKDTVDLILATNAPARKKMKFERMIALEKLDVKPDNLLTYYIWAEDVGPDGNVRRRESDIFFAEVRPFDESFSERENQEAAVARGSSNNRVGLSRNLRTCSRKSLLPAGNCAGRNTTTQALRKASHHEKIIPDPSRRRFADHRNGGCDRRWIGASLQADRRQGLPRRHLRPGEIAGSGHQHREGESRETQGSRG